MAERTQLLYLEPDDEVTTLVRRLREADAERVVVVAPGRSKVAGSSVALRLLAQVAGEEGRELALVADAAGRSLGAEAGIPTFATVAEASGDGAVSAEPAPVRRAPIRVVRGEEATAAVALPPPPVTEETRPVPVAPRPPVRRPAPRPRARPQVTAGRRLPRVLLAALLGLLLLAGAAAAAVAPAATITIVPASETVGPVTYRLVLEDPEVHSGTVEATQPGTAGGTYHDLAPAEGTVVLFNWNLGRAVLVPQGARVAAGDVVFETVAAVSVPPGRLIRFNPLTVESGEAGVGVVAVEPGPQGNLDAGAIDTIVNENLAAQLRGLPDNPERLVVNPEATAGGVDRSGPLIREEDVVAASSALVDALAAQVEEARGELGDAVVAETAQPEPSIHVPEGLPGTRDQESFEVNGSQEYRWVYADRAEVIAAAEERALEDGSLVAEGFSLDPDSLRVEIVRAAEDGDALLVEVRVTGRSTAQVDAAAVRARVAGLSEQEARTALAGLGTVDVELWPGWVDAVPRLEWRIDVRVASGG